MLDDATRSIVNLMFMCIGIWIAHNLYQTDKAKWKTVLAWGLAFVVSGVSATLLFEQFGGDVLTHERISMFCGFCCIFVYMYLFPSIPTSQRVFTYFFVDNSMYIIVVLSRFVAVFVTGFLGLPVNILFIILYFLFTFVYCLLFIKRLKSVMLRGLAAFHKQMKPLAILAFFCYITMIFFVDPWGPLYSVDLWHLVAVLCFCGLIVCMYFVAMRTLEVINSGVAKDLEAKMLKKQILLSERYYESMMENIEKTKAMRHDLNHHIRVMESMCRDEKWEELRQYMEALQTISARDKLPIYCEDYVANVLLNHYDSECRRLGISYRCEASLPPTVMKDKLKLCIVLGNGLQNALEACQRMLQMKGQASEIYIHVTLKVFKNNLVLEIRNSFDGRVQMEGHKLKTRKSEPDHGIGLSNIKSTAELYKGYCSAVFTEKEFVLNVLLNLTEEQV